MADDISRLGYEIDSSQAAGAAKNLLAMSKAAGDAATSQARLGAQARDTSGKFLSLSASNKKTSETIKDLAREFNTTLSAQLAYSEAQKRLANAVKLGVVNEKEHATQLKILHDGYLSASSSAQHMAGSVGAANRHILNMGFQFQDIGMMLASGQNPLILAMQQGTQVAGIFSQMKMEGQSVFGALKGGLLGLINPTSLLTIGVIAGGAALLQWGMSALGAGDDADTLQEKLDKLSDSIEEYKSAVKTGAEYNKYIEDSFGKVTSETIDLAERMKNLRITEVLLQANEAAVKLSDTFSGGFRSELSRIEDLIKQEWFDDAANEAKRFADALDDIRSSSNISDQLTSIKNLSSMFLDATGGISSMTKEQREFYSSLLDTEGKLTAAVNLTFDADSQTKQWANSMYSVKSAIDAILMSLSSIGGGVISNAAKQVEIDALKAGKSIKDASRASQDFQKTIEFDARRRGANWIQRLVIDAEEYQYKLGQTLDSEIEAQQKLSREREKSSASALKSAQKGFQSLRELLGQNTIFEFAEYEKRQSQLDAALQKRLLTEDTYQKMKTQLRTFYFGSEYEQQALQYQMDQDALQQALDKRLITEQEYHMKMLSLRGGYAGTALDQTQTFMGDMADAMQSGNSKMIAAAQVFASVEALINAYRAYNQVLADPSLPWFAKIPAAVSVLAAGTRTVQSIKSLSGSGSGSSTSAAPSGASAVASKEPERVVRISVEGEKWMKDLVEGLITQLYEASSDGARVVIAR